MEAFKILSELDKDKKEILVNVITGLNNAVRDYESRINNAINQLQR